MSDEKQLLEMREMLKLKSHEHPREDLESILLNDFRSRFPQEKSSKLSFDGIWGRLLAFGGIGVPAAFAIFFFTLNVMKNDDGNSLAVNNLPQIVSADRLEPIIVSTTLPSFRSIPIEF